MELPEDALYSKEHEWAIVDGNVATIGISDYAQSQLGDITFIELPAIDDEVEQFDNLAAIESVKAASDIYAPLSGKIIEVNSELESEPGDINRSPYEKGWIAKIEITDEEELNNLMKDEEYKSYLESSG